MSSSSPKTRRTRFVCISDTHNHQPKLPPGDVLIHAGDITNQGSYKELSKMVRWLEEAPFEAKIVVAGNHDITLDKDFYAQHGLSFHNQHPESHLACLRLLTSSPSITYLAHSSAIIRLTSPHGPQTSFRVFGSPYSPRDGLWAFSYASPPALSPPNAAASSNLWGDIPLETDVVVSHTPARTHCDERTSTRAAAGCESLREALWRVRPRMAICGHVHDGRGAQVVRWDLGAEHISFAEERVTKWEDPGEGSKKLSLVDLTGRKDGSRLDNDGSHPRQHPAAMAAPDEASPLTLSSAAREKSNKSHLSVKEDDRTSAQRDRQALLGRLGRLETCIVNAAIMKSKYPHVGGKQFHKPIVVDLELPVWQD